MTELGEFGMYLAMGSIGVCFVMALSPVFKAFARRIEGPAAPPPRVIGMMPITSWGSRCK